MSQPGPEISAHRLTEPPANGGSAKRRLPRYRWLALSIGLVYLIVGGLFVHLTVTADGSEYLQMGRNLLEHHSFSYDGVNPVVGKPPGLPFLVAVYLALFGDIHGFQFVLLLLMLGSFLILSSSSRRLLGDGWATVLLLFLVCLFPLNYLVENVLSEPGFLFLSSIGIYLLLRGIDGKHHWSAVAAGGAFAAATYFRPITLFWPLVLILFACLFFREQLRRLLVVLVVHIIVTPWMVRNWLEFKAVVPMVTNWAPLYYMTDEEVWRINFFQGSVYTRDMEWHREILDGQFQFNWKPGQRFKELAISNIKSHPGEYLSRCFRQALFVWTYLPGTKPWHQTQPMLFWIGRAAMAAFYWLTVMGAAALWKTRRKTVVILLGFALYTAVLVFPVSTESRYLVPAYLWLLPLTFNGISRVALKIRGRSNLSPSVLSY
jgi:hypothetical protein